MREAYYIPAYAQSLKFEVAMGFKSLEQATHELAKAGWLSPAGPSAKEILDKASMPKQSWQETYIKARQAFRKAFEKGLIDEKTYHQFVA